VLCADTQQESLAMRLQSPKVGMFDAASGKIGFAFAGNVQFATAAIQKCADKLRPISDPDLVIPEVERVLDRYYRKTVYAHPDRHYNQSLDYEFLIAFKHPTRGSYLFATHGTTLRSIVSFECIGIGMELGRYLAAPTYNHLMSESQVLRIASYTMSRVKAYVPGCGGETIFIVLRNNGESGFVQASATPFSTAPSPGNEVWQIESMAEQFDRMAQTLLFATADNSLSDEDFQGHLNAFVFSMVTSRSLWRGEQSSPQPPTADQRPQPPSPESSGGSDVS